MLSDESSSFIAAVHAGWRGTFYNIVNKTIERILNEFNCNPEDIIAALGPSIGGCCYEVSKPLWDKFNHEHMLFPDDFSQIGEKYYLNLQSINRNFLKNSGVQQIDLLAKCTKCEDDFYSYRRDKSKKNYKYFDNVDNGENKMLSIGGVIQNEDYDAVQTAIGNEQLPHSSYTITVKNENKGEGSLPIKLYVLELPTAHIAIGFTLPNTKELEKDISLTFTTYPDAQRPNPEYLKFKCKFSEDQKEEKRDGDPLEKLEYVGYKLEKGYNEKKATFYLFDYQGIGNT